MNVISIGSGCKKNTCPPFPPKEAMIPHTSLLLPLTRRCFMQGAGRYCYQKGADLVLGHELQQVVDHFTSLIGATMIHLIKTTDKYSNVLGK